MGHLTVVDPFPYLATVQKLKITDTATEYLAWAAEVEAILSLCGMDKVTRTPTRKMTYSVKLVDTNAHAIITLCLGRCMIQHLPVGWDEHPNESRTRAQIVWEAVRAIKMQQYAAPQGSKAKQ